MGTGYRVAVHQASLNSGDIEVCIPIDIHFMYRFELMDDGHDIAVVAIVIRDTSKDILPAIGKGALKEIIDSIKVRI